MVALQVVNGQLILYRGAHGSTVGSVVRCGARGAQGGVSRVAVGSVASAECVPSGAGSEGRGRWENCKGGGGGGGGWEGGRCVG